MINGLSTSQSNLKTSSLLDMVSKEQTSKKQSIELVKKGEAGYMEVMDEDRDGVVTMEEFNNYCAENGVSEEAKLALLESIQSAKTTKQIQEKTQAAQENQKEEGETQDASQEESKIVYAKKGDDKYNEVMDENKNGVVTYEEYLKYCQNKAQNQKSEDKASSKVDEAYSSSDEVSEEEITVEAEA